VDPGRRHALVIMVAAMAAITTAKEAREIGGEAISGTGPARGEMLFDWVREHRPAQVLELGFAHGYAAVHIGAALEANGEGQLISVDNVSAHERRPPAATLVEQADLGHRIELVYEPTSYTWFLHRQLREQLRDGVIEPRYDFCFLDGAHTWNVDGFAFTLVDLLLRPGGTILFDDLRWRPGDDADPEDRAVDGMAEVWDLLVATHPRYGELVTDGDWGWATKSAEDVEVRTIVRRDGLGAVKDLAKQARSKVNARFGR
jgi:predicted O-methyltransferase YrrM